MKLEIGSEKKVFEFISNIKNDKVVIISHIDLDGITAAKVVNEIVNASEIKFIEYEELNEDLVEDLKKRK